MCCTDFLLIWCCSVLRQRSANEDREGFLALSKLNLASPWTVIRSFVVRQLWCWSVFDENFETLHNSGLVQEVKGDWPALTTTLTSQIHKRVFRCNCRFNWGFASFFFLNCVFSPLIYTCITLSLNNKDTIMKKDDNKVVIVDTEYVSVLFSHSLGKWK